MCDVKKYHVEYDVESFIGPEEFLGYPILVPMNAVITEIKPPVKAGDMIDDSEILDRVPAYSVVVDIDGDAWQRRGNGTWDIAGGGYNYRGNVVIGSYGPVTIVHIPRPEESK